jgi:hypothetical protein
METVFNHNPTNEILDAIGVPQRTVNDYIQALILQTGKERLEVRVLSDLQEFFDYTKNQVESSRIENQLQKNGAYATLFNE